MASKLRRTTRGKRSGGSRGSRGSRRSGIASAKRQARAQRARRRAEDRRSQANIDKARSGGNRRTADVRRGGTSTGRESGIAAANKFDRTKKAKSLQQSVGSLDRRVEKALKEGNTDLAKDLRSRQNKFVKQLAMERAKKVPGGTIQGNVRTSSGDPILTSKGFDVFQETVDQDFIDPTRKLQNEFPDQFREMYPITSAIQGGLPAVRLAKQAFGIDDKPIPYNLEDMPGVRYPLDITFGAGEGATPITTRSDRQDPLDERPFTISDRQPQFKDDYGAAAPLTPVTIETLQDLGIDENQIGPVQDDPTTDIIEQDSNVGSALQQYYRQIEQNKKDFPEFFENRSPFFLPEEKKTELNLQAADALREGEIATYGRQLTDQDLEKIGINRADYNQNFDTPLVQRQVMAYLNAQNNAVIPPAITTMSGQEYVDNFNQNQGDLIEQLTNDPSSLNITADQADDVINLMQNKDMFAPINYFD